jgi:lipoprotein-anchoring transpeptidase ErfK/SrfK
LLDGRRQWLLYGLLQRPHRRGLPRAGHPDHQGSVEISPADGLLPDDGKPGTIIVDTGEKYLYFVEGGGKAVRYGIGVGREGFEWKGTARVGAKREWPVWTPPPAMIKRQPELAKWRGGMPGGPQNALGARALYLHNKGGDSGYRLHGTPEWWSIGKAMSSGCIRMMNQDVIDLYERASVGAKVIVK